MIKIIKSITCVTLAFAAIVTLAVSGVYLYLMPSLPDASEINKIQLQIPLRIYSSDGQLIGEFGDNRRTPVSRKDIPETFIQAFLAAEDARFYEHMGISFQSLGRAVWQMATQSDQQTGGSTITMQVAKNYFLTPDRTIIRKLKEIFLSIQIEQSLTKDQILELYVNKIFLGNRAYGIAAAAQVYYGKSCQELTLAEIAMIAGLPKAPSTDNPIANPDRALERRNWVLKRMQQLGYISEENYLAAKSEPANTTRHQAAIEIDAPYIAEMARAKALELFGENAYNDGLRVITTVNGKLQQTAQEAIRNGLNAYDERHGFRRVESHLNDLTTQAKAEFFSTTSSVATLEPAIVTGLKEQSLSAELANGLTIEIPWDNGLAAAKRYISENRIGPAPKKASDIVKIGDAIRVQNRQGNWHLTQIPQIEAALVALNPRNGAIISLVGGYDFYKNKFNRATQAKRQIGSNIKPFIYAAALQNGFSPATIINDAPVVFDDNQLDNSWRPENDSGNFAGPTRFREALYKSRNLVSVRIVRELGISTTIDYISQFGFEKSRLPNDLTLALGSPVFTPLEVATGYAAIANSGFRIEPFLVSEIQDSQGNVIYRANPPTACDPCEAANQPISTNQGKALSREKPVDEAGSIEELTTNEKPEPVKTAMRIMDERVAFLIDDILHDVIGPEGTGKKAMVLERPDLAGKTGTTNGPTDAWFSGYHPSIITTVWLGFNNNAPLGRNEYGGSAALPIWIEYMKEALANQPVITHQVPPGIATVLINKENGKLARPGQENSMFEYIQEELLPTLGTAPVEGQDNQIKSFEEIF